ncbi:MAG TPA: hypothetical protein V6D19_19320 [Stenomitos sp.]
MDELRAALELATEDELKDLTEILFRRKFNPLDYLQGLDPSQVQSPDRRRWINAIEDRFRFLAADGLTVLRGESRAVTYRQVLIRVCRYLKLRFSPSLSTTDLEAEIFLHLMQRTWKKMPTGDREVLVERIRAALQQSAADPLPLNCHIDPLRLAVEGGSALAVSSVVRPFIVRQLAQQFALHFAAVQSASEAAGVLALQAARQSLTVAAIRYTSTRSLFAAVSGVLWASFVVDLGWRSIATNYGRIIPIIFTLAQIRLTRSEWACAY